MGERVNPTAARTLAPGEAVDLVAAMAHFEGTRGPTVIDVSGTGPWGITQGAHCRSLMRSEVPRSAPRDGLSRRLWLLDRDQERGS